jgi:multiple sugar transport system substrate-binding protein
MKRSQQLVAVTLVAGLGVVAASCGGGSESEADEVTTIRFQFTGEPEEAAVYDLLIDAFEAENPDVKVQAESYGSKGDQLAKLVSSFAGGEPPDVFLLNFREYSQFVTRDAIDPIGPRLEDVDIDVDDYYAPPFEAFSYDGELQCLPQNASSLVVYWNRILFERAGVAPPTDGWTWEQFRQAAIDLTGGGLHGLGIEPVLIRLAPFVWGAGGELTDDPDEPTRFTLDTPEAREALSFLVGLVRDDHVVPDETELAAQDLESRFTAGKLGMLLSSRRDVPAFREVQGLDWDVAPLPVGRQPSTILHSDGFCLARDGDHLDEAARFAAFAGSATGQGVLSLGGRIVPSLKSVATTAFLDPAQAPDNDQVFLDNIEVMRRTPVLPTWPEIEDVGEEILTRAFYEPGYTIDQAIADLDAQTRDLFAEGHED